MSRDDGSLATGQIEREFLNFSDGGHEVTIRRGVLEASGVHASGGEVCAMVFATRVIN